MNRSHYLSIYGYKLAMSVSFAFITTVIAAPVLK